MSFYVDLNVRNQLVLVAGGGRVALRKARQLFQEGAIIHVIAPAILPELRMIACQYDERAYTSSDLHEAIFLVIAATDDTDLNHQIIEEANHQNILAMSIHQDEDATVHALRQYQKEEYSLAVSTKGRFPLLSSVILDHFVQMMEDVYLPRLPMLTELRTYVYSLSLSEQATRNLLSQLMKLQEFQLTFLQEAIKKTKACVLVFHGVARLSVTSEIMQTLSLLQESSKLPFTFAFLSANIRKQLPEQACPFACEELFQLCNLLHIELTVFPMFIQKGRYYRRLSLITAQYEYPMAELPFASMQDCFLLVQYLSVQYHKEETDMIIVLHSSDDQQFFQYLSACTKQFPDLSCCYEKDHLPRQVETQMCLLVMLSGNHAKSWDGEAISCFSDPYLREMIVQKIRQSIKKYNLA